MHQQTKSSTILSLLVANSAVSILFQSFQYRLLVKNLLKYLPQFNTSSLDSLNKQCVAYFYLQGQSNSKNPSAHQDTMPSPIQMDNIINFHIKIEQYELQQLDKSKQIRHYINQSPGIQSFTSLNYSMSKSQNAEQANTVNIQNYFNKSNQNQTPTQDVHEFLDSNDKNQSKHTGESSQQQFHSSELLPLNLKQQQDLVLQSELDAVKKHLYMLRRYKKKNLQEERQRMDAQAKKKSPLFFGKGIDHTYQYDGAPLQFKKTKDEQSLVTQVKSNFQQLEDSRNRKNRSGFLNKSKKSSLNSSSLDLTGIKGQTSVLVNLEQKQESNPERKLSTQQLKKVSFNNCNKRQISHLPFIQLKQNTKLIQNKKQLAGSVSLRSSLNRSKISSLSSQNNNKFKSFAQIEQQKRLEKSRQKVLQLTQTNDILQIDIMPPTLNLNRNSEPMRRQSKMMQKYLKKLTEERSKIQKWMDDDQTHKSFNFQQLTVPQKYPIQRYYDYDYQGEKQSYQYEITSKLSSKRNSIADAMNLS